MKKMTPPPTNSCEIALEQCQGQLSQVAKHLVMNLRPLQPQPPQPPKSE